MCGIIDKGITPWNGELGGICAFEGPDICTGDPPSVITLVINKTLAAELKIDKLSPITPGPLETIPPRISTPVIPFDAAEVRSTSMYIPFPVGCGTLWGCCVAL